MATAGCIWVTVSWAVLLGVTVLLFVLYTCWSIAIGLMNEQILRTTNPDRWSPFLSIKYSISTQHSRHFIFSSSGWSLSLVIVSNRIGRGGQVRRSLAQTPIYPPPSWHPATEHKWWVLCRKLELSDHQPSLSEQISPVCLHPADLSPQKKAQSQLLHSLIPHGSEHPLTQTCPFWIPSNLLPLEESISVIRKIPCALILFSECSLHPGEHMITPGHARLTWTPFWVTADSLSHSSGLQAGSEGHVLSATPRLCALPPS